jgi:hypothetical protein
MNVLYPAEHTKDVIHRVGKCEVAIFFKFHYMYLTSESKEYIFFFHVSNGLAILRARGTGTLEGTHLITQT